MEVMGRMTGNNYLLIHLFSPLEVLCFGLIYAGWTSGRWRAAMLVGTLLTLAAWGTLFPFEDHHRFNGLSYHLEALALMLGSMALLWHLAQDLSRSLFTRASFWVLTSMLGEQAFSFFVYLTRDWFLAHALPALRLLVLVRAFVEVGSYLVYAWAFRCHLRTQD